MRPARDGRRSSGSAWRAQDTLKDGNILRGWEGYLGKQARARAHACKLTRDSRRGRSHHVCSRPPCSHLAPTSPGEQRRDPADQSIPRGGPDVLELIGHLWPPVRLRRQGAVGDRLRLAQRSWRRLTRREGEEGAARRAEARAGGGGGVGGMAWGGRALAAPCVHWPHARSRRLNARAAHRGCIYTCCIDRAAPSPPGAGVTSYTDTVFT